MRVARCAALGPRPHSRQLSKVSGEASLLVVRLAATLYVRAVRAGCTATRVALASALLCAAGSADAQSSRFTLGDLAPLTFVYDADFLASLPNNDSVFPLLETVPASITADRFSSGGLSLGQPARLGGPLSSWTQTMFRVDGVDVTDPTGSGTPIFVPDLRLWRRVRVTTGVPRAESDASGVEIGVELNRPADKWTRSIEGSLSHGGLAGRTPSTEAPALARLDGWDRIAFLASGPFGENGGAVLSGSWARATEFRRAELVPADADRASALFHLRFAATERHEVRLTGAAERRASPLDLRAPLGQPQATSADTVGHVQAVVTNRDTAARPWRVFGGFGHRRRVPTVDAQHVAVFERLVDGPVSALSSLSSTTTRLWSLGASVQPRTRLGRTPHTFDLGTEVKGGSSTAGESFSGLAGETIHGQPARVWSLRDSGRPSARHNLTFGAYVGDQVDIGPRLILDGGLRVEWLTGSADGSTTSLRWWSWLPRAGARWLATDGGALAVFAGYSRLGHRLALDYLAVGDPGASTASVFRWAAPAPLASAVADGRTPVALLGPGTGGRPDFSVIDDRLRRPTADEVTVGLQARLGSNLLLGLSGFARQERHLLELVNRGVPETAYSSFEVPDPGSNVLSPEDDRLIRVFDRLPASFGLDRYLLTNVDGQGASLKGLELQLGIRTGRFTLLGSATAWMGEGPAAGRGFGPLENDHTVIGELFVTPNAATLARGRLFVDRGYAAKLTGMWRLPSETTLGWIARYQDGQPFARMLVFPDLNQGTEAVRAFANGDSRFMFVGTLDARLQKRFALGPRRIDAIIDVYNLLNLKYSVEEDVAAPPDVRIPTAVQPPLSIAVGLRVTF